MFLVRTSTKCTISCEAIITCTVKGVVIIRGTESIAMAIIVVTWIKY
jgi:hypothetical protein